MLQTTSGVRRRRRFWGALPVVAALLAGCSGGSDSGGTPGEGDGPSSSGPAPSSYPLSKPPVTIPSVRDFDSARGPGWRPGSGSRVVADPGGPLADEARLLAGELDASYGEGPARQGDIELAIDGEVEGDEAYRVTTRGGRVRVTGAEDAGVFYGTRTVLQTLRAGRPVPEGVMKDGPDRLQRGLNIDIARKHFTPGWIEARIRDMADLKLNQLGLHFSDDQGFRIESDSHPEVVSEQHLTKAELRRILELAERLHVTVVPEIDSPGHLGAVLDAHPELRLTSGRGVPAPGAIDISRPDSARIVDDLLREYADDFPGPYFHLGADEYRALTADDPQAAYPGLAARARQEYGADARVRDLTTGWLNDRARVLKEKGKKPKAWNDGFFPGGAVRADQDIEAEYWTGKEIGAREPASYLREGRPVVNLNDEYLYYVLGEPNDFSYPTGERIYEEWTPAVLRGTKPVPSELAGPDRVLGARFAVWGDIAGAQTQEQVARGIRMPLRALSQKLWDPREPALSWSAFRERADRLDEGEPTGSRH